MISQESNYGDSHNSGSSLPTAIPSQIQAYAPALVAAREHKKTVVPIDSGVSAATADDFNPGETFQDRVADDDAVKNAPERLPYCNSSPAPIRHLIPQWNVADASSKHYHLGTVLFS